MPQLCVGNQAHPHKWDVASCSRKYKYDIDSLFIITTPRTVLPGLVERHRRSQGLRCRLGFPERRRPDRASPLAQYLAGFACRRNPFPPRPRSKRRAVRPRRAASSGAVGYPPILPSRASGEDRHRGCTRTERNRFCPLSSSRALHRRSISAGHRASRVPGLRLANSRARATGSRYSFATIKSRLRAGHPNLTM